MVCFSYFSPQPYSKPSILKQRIVTFGEILYQCTQPAPGILHHCSCWVLQMAKFPMEIWILERQTGRHPPLFPHITPGKCDEFSVTGPSYSFGRDAQMAPKASGIRDRGFYSHLLHDVDVEPTNNLCLQCRQSCKHFQNQALCLGHEAEKALMDTAPSFCSKELCNEDGRGLETAQNLQQKTDCQE